MCELFKLIFELSFALSAHCNKLEIVCDLPEPVEPTTAICLLKNLFPSTGILIFSWWWISVLNMNFFCSSTEFSKISLILSYVVGVTPAGGRDNVSPPR